LPVLNASAAGIDIGATKIYVAVPQNCDAQPVRSFETFTQDLEALAQWLRTCKIQTVAMESTGVYWIPLFRILEAHGFTVCLVNACHWRNAPGRKTDVCDCQWLQYLHACGLLRGSFRPSYTRNRDRPSLLQPPSPPNSVPLPSHQSGGLGTQQIRSP